ncbi:reverse transcriptase [Phytophthora cinnamomi]|uniref:reverse transcriptase n=1 Tax=Phytophthora cinnamomi TaxID=4785 RepID=UPI00355A5D79|nr:reverse transcriptase [Phytophthora cinnamomi]
MRRRFDRDESGCVRDILSAAAEPADPDGQKTSADPTCPLPVDDVHGYFDGFHTPRVDFDFDAPRGAPFHDLLGNLPPPTEAADALRIDISLENVEDQLLRARRQSAPGHDGIGYDVLHRLKTELLPLLYADLLVLLEASPAAILLEGWHRQVSPQEGIAHGAVQLAATVPPAHAVQIVRQRTSPPPLHMAGSQRQIHGSPEGVPRDEWVQQAQFLDGNGT